MAQPSGWQLCTTDWVKIEGAISEGRGTEMTMAGERAKVIQHALGRSTYHTDQQYRAALRALKHTIRKVYTNSANTSQFNAALKILNKTDRSNAQAVATTCYLCGQPIFTPQAFKTARADRPSDCLGYQEAEHVLPLKMGHKLLSIPGQKIDGTRNVNDTNTYSDNQVILEMKNSHRLCNQIKSNIMFIKFTGGPTGSWVLKGELIDKFGVVVENCKKDRNDAKCKNAGAPSDVTVSTDTMKTGLNAVCTFLNGAKPPDWNSNKLDRIKGRLALNPEILQDASPAAAAPTWWWGPLGYIMYRYATKIARKTTNNDTIRQLLKDTWNKYKTPEAAEKANDEENTVANEELQSQSQSITQQPGASQITQTSNAVHQQLDLATIAEGGGEDEEDEEIVIDNDTKKLLKDIGSIDDPVQLVENIIEAEEDAGEAEEEAAEGADDAEAQQAAYTLVMLSSAAEAARNLLESAAEAGRAAAAAQERARAAVVGASGVAGWAGGRAAAEKRKLAEGGRHVGGAKSARKSLGGGRRGSVEGREGVAEAVGVAEAEEPSAVGVAEAEAEAEAEEPSAVGAAAAAAEAAAAEAAVEAQAVLVAADADADAARKNRARRRALRAVRNAAEKRSEYNIINNTFWGRHINELNPENRNALNAYRQGTFSSLIAWLTSEINPK